jgi:prolipoprotein diacylglyceryl transferase
MALIATIPAPPFDSFTVGPFTIQLYGICIALGVFAAVWITQRRFVERGWDPDDVARAAMWAVPAGVIGARLYHVITDIDRFRGNWGEVPLIWEGGLGIWGGIAVGTAVGLWWTKRHGYPIPEVLDAIAPAFPVAQAIGRFGNYFNQELFGRPTDLPWALEVDLSQRPTGYTEFETFHPTFLYEALWNLGLAAFLIWVAPKVFRRLRTGDLFALYVLGYTLGRVWIEALRIDTATEFFGIRLNIFTSVIVGLAALVYLLWPKSKKPPATDSDVSQERETSI